MVNGYDSLNITKLDILDFLPEIKVAVEYRLRGRTIDTVPASLFDFKDVEEVKEHCRQHHPKDEIKTIYAEVYNSVEEEENA